MYIRGSGAGANLKEKYIQSKYTKALARNIRETLRKGFLYRVTSRGYTEEVRLGRGYSCAG